MTVQVLYFAGLRESFGTAGEAVDLPAAGLTVAGLRDWLAAERGRDRLLTVKNLRCAVNQEMAGLGATVADGDEVAFFPPVTGG